jgi:Flp pilus assembly protein CpaB
VALAGLWITIRSAAPPPPSTVAVLEAVRDLPAGRTLTGDDLRTASRAAVDAPRGRLTALTAATGRVLASPVRSGELLTDTRLVGPGLLTGQAAGTVAVPVRLGDPAAGAIVRAGDRVDVMASNAISAWSSEPDLADGTALPGETAGAGRNPGRDGGSPEAERVAAGALVLAVPGAASAGDGGGTGSAGIGLGGQDGSALSGGMSAEKSASLLVLAVSPAEAGRLAAVQGVGHIAIALLPQR